MVKKLIGNGYFKRYFLFTLGIFFMSFGVSLIIKADLGTSPISNLPYVLSILFEPGIGMFMLYFNIGLILIQILLLGKKTPKSILLQLPVAVLFSYFIELTMQMLSSLQPEFYMQKATFLFIGCFVMALGIYLEVIADVIMLSGEAFVKTISDKFKLDFGYVKVGFDATLAISSGIVGYVYAQKIIGVREGTIIAALVVGLMVKFLKHRLSFVEEYVQRESIMAQNLLLDRTNTIVTISREYGSGGRDIGKRLARELNISFFDSDIIKLISKDYQFSEEYVKENEQSISSNNFSFDSLLSLDANIQTPEDKLFQAEAKAIRQLASKESCVIIGRCADFILKDFSNCINVFIYADETFKIKQVSKREHLSKSDAKMRIEDINNKRATHYNYYTRKIWGLAQNYDIAISSSFVGVDETIAIISKYVKGKMNKAVSK